MKIKKLLNGILACTLVLSTVSVASATELDTNNAPLVSESSVLAVTQTSDVHSASEIEAMKQEIIASTTVDNGYQGEVNEIPEITSYVNEEGETVYTQTVTVDLDTDVMPLYSSLGNTRSVRSTKSLGLSLDPRQSGWSIPITFRFSTLPSGAKVESIEIKPNNPKVNGGYNAFIGCVVFNNVELTSPKNDVGKIYWNASGMKSTSLLRGKEASGTWSMRVYGTNITNKTPNAMGIEIGFGSLIYNSVDLTISYTV